MTKEEAIAHNGNTPITRRECAERHTATATHLETAMQDTKKEIQRSISGMKWATGIVGTVVCLVMTSSLHLSLSAQNRVNILEITTVKEMSQLRAEIAGLPREVPPAWFRDQVSDMHDQLQALTDAVAKLRVDISAGRLDARPTPPNNQEPS